jgi:hypothetical protein
LALATMACTAKVASFVFTYPFESIKIYSQLNKSLTDLPNLYHGFGTFTVLATIQCFINYNIFFATIDALKPHVPHSSTYFYASVISCFMTSFIKVPMSYISRNIIFIKNKSGVAAVRHLLEKMDKDIFKTSWLMNILSDIPDSFVKFFVNSWIQINLPLITNFNRSCITGLITSIVNMPLDYILTQSMCGRSMVKNIIKDDFFNKCMSGLKYRIIACMIGNIVFFNSFNTLQALSSITV